VTRRLLAGTPVEVLLEPTGRNTAACIGLAALHLRRRAPGVPVVVLPADHFIGRPDLFNQILAAAASSAREGAIVTLGIEPTRPETGYGYIKVDPRSEVGRVSGTTTLNRVDCFVEKPDLERALEYLRTGQYLWNSGIFIFTPEVILDEIAIHLPVLAAGLAMIDEAIGRADYQDVLESVYQSLPAVSIDHGIIEKTTRHLYVIRSDFGWSDVGSWQALYELKENEADESGNLLQGSVWVEDSRRNLVYSMSGRKVAILGVEGLAIVDTEDTLMVADLARSQDVKRFALREKKRE
jgi:mannose-1-phosphate guanylyltransferase